MAYLEFLFYAAGLFALHHNAKRTLLERVGSEGASLLALGASVCYAMVQAPPLAYLLPVLTWALEVKFRSQLWRERRGLRLKLSRAGVEKRLELVALLQWHNRLSPCPDGTVRTKLLGLVLCPEVSVSQIVYALGDRLDDIHFADLVLESDLLRGSLHA